MTQQSSYLVAGLIKWALIGTLAVAGIQLIIASLDFAAGLQLATQVRS